MHGMLMKETRSDRDVKMQKRICVKIRNSVRCGEGVLDVINWIKRDVLLEDIK